MSIHLVPHRKPPDTLFVPIPMPQTFIFVKFAHKTVSGTSRTVEE